VSRGTSYFIARGPHLLIGNRAERHAESALQPLDARCIPFSERAVTFARNMSPRKRERERERKIEARADPTLSLIPRDLPTVALLRIAEISRRYGDIARG